MTVTTESPKRPHSSELGAGAGFTFEDCVALTYLAALLGECYARGNADKPVSRVSLQQASFGEPLDDLIVDFGQGKNKARLSLQVKRALTISAAPSNTDFRDVITESFHTWRKPNFHKNVDRYGAAVGQINSDKARTLEYLCETARESTSTDHFETRFSESGNASDAARAIRADIETLLAEANGSECTAAEVHEFLAHFVLVPFDFLYEGNRDLPQIHNQLRDCLAAEHISQAPVLASTLCRKARESAGKSGEFDRPRLIRELASQFRLRAAPSIQPDLDLLSALGRTWVQDIQNDVSGTILERPELASKLETTIADSRFVRISGMPGSGKSVLLRRRVEADLIRGPVFFLKAERLEGKNWSSFATNNGLSTVPLKTLLSELSAVGATTLYIDGLDRVETANQGIILDVLRTIFGSSDFEEWKVVASLRTSGLEPLRNWLGDILGKVSVTSLEVPNLDDAEAKALAKEKPALRGLLFGPNQVRQISRRPFFAKILCQSADTATGGFEPQSEVDLAEHWYDRGGYDAAGQAATLRQRAIVEIGGLQARQLSRPIAVRSLSAATPEQLDGLVRDGVLQHVRKGHTIRFAHDIFFEWSFLHALADREEMWIDLVRDCGEPPAIARAVELLAAREYSEGKTWLATLNAIGQAPMRTQWSRAWLLGTLSHPTIEKDVTTFTAAVFADDCRLLERALVWFQAEKIEPNPNILKLDLPPQERLRIADAVGLPSDVPAWRRFIHFLLNHIDRIPARLYPQVVAVFEVWQNLWAEFKNDISSTLLAHAASWLEELDLEERSARWANVEGRGDLAKTLANMILRGATVRPDLAEQYLRRILAKERTDSERYGAIMSWAPTLARTHPELLVELALGFLKEELPEEKEERERLADAAVRIAFNAASTKPETERSEKDRAAIARGLTQRRLPESYTLAWNDLYLRDDTHAPPSPLREPFHSLFAHRPDLALNLLAALCNHATAAWRQLLSRDHFTRGTPLPLQIEFPWGSQQFWGGEREYLFHRGNQGPKVIASGFMALEEWCFKELERGVPVDSLIQQVLTGNTAIASLGAAVTIALHTQHVSDTVLALLSHQRLLAADDNRAMQDLGGRSPLLIGFTRGRADSSHIAALSNAAARPVRKQRLRFLVQLYFFNGKYRRRIQTAIRKFKKNLPFEMAEHRRDRNAVEHYSKQAFMYQELVDRKSYRIRQRPAEPGVVEIQHVGLPATAAQREIDVQEATSRLEVTSLQMRAEKILAGEPAEDRWVQKAVSQARLLDNPSVFLQGHDMDAAACKGAVAGAAALALKHPKLVSAEDLSWARGALYRATKAAEERTGSWFFGALMPWHHGVYAAQGLGIDIRNAGGRPEAAELLLALAAHPLESVSLAAINVALNLWDVDPHLARTTLHLALELCRLEPPAPGVRPTSASVHLDARVAAVLEHALTLYREQSVNNELPAPEPAWLWIGPGSPNQDGVLDDQETDEDGPGAGRWGVPAVRWYSEYAAKIMAMIPWQHVLQTPAKAPLLRFMDVVLRWTIQKNNPPGTAATRHQSGDPHLSEWTCELGCSLGMIAGLLPMLEVKERILDPILELDDDKCFAILESFVRTFISSYIYDAHVMPAHAFEVVSLCLERLLQSASFNRKGYSRGKFYGFDAPRLLDAFMFVSVKDAMGAARFANGDWAEIAFILPLIGRLMDTGGWATAVMSRFLTLCERAGEAYPAGKFADQVLHVMEQNPGLTATWKDTVLPARIAGLVKLHASASAGMTLVLRQRLLRILDLLVDIGDRRSAALQQSEYFREVTV